VTGVFITGTDTGVGKTFVTASLLEGLGAHGLSVVGMKPVASGCAWVNGQLSNDDVLTLLKASNSPLSYSDANIYSFAQPVSPHIAARLSGAVIDLSLVKQGVAALEKRFGCVVVEGVGGWAVPLNDRDTVEDMALALGLPVLLVVGLRLGCINHALLTERAIRAAGLPLLGWVSNQVEERLAFVDEVVSTLASRLESPRLGSIGFLPEVARHGTSPEAGNPGFDLAGELLRRLAL
jgi:dethiobiotin synthetase